MKKIFLQILLVINIIKSEPTKEIDSMLILMEKIENNKIKIQKFLTKDTYHKLFLEFKNKNILKEPSNIEIVNYYRNMIDWQEKIMQKKEFYDSLEELNDKDI